MLKHLLPFEDEPRTTQIKALFIHDVEYSLSLLQVETYALNQAAKIFHSDSIQRIKIVETLPCKIARGWAVIVEYTANG